MAALDKQLLFALAERTGRAVDHAYTALVHQLGLTQAFFQKGFGQLDLIDFHLDVALFKTWPPEHFDTPLTWKKLQEGSYRGHAYEVFKASFPTPSFGRIYDALPEESRTAHAMWILPRRPAHQTPCMVHLAATGDHGFTRRMHLGLPLVEQGIATLALESPYYGVRKPSYQQGAKLHRVSDLLLLGRVTIEESLFLLQWLSQQGHGQLGMSGLSMGGVHASMVASLYPGPLALTPLLAPRSAAAAYCGGALYHATAWDKIVMDSEQRLQDIVRAVTSAARGSSSLAAARIQRILEVSAALQQEQHGAASSGGGSSGEGGLSSSTLAAAGAALQAATEQAGRMGPAAAAAATAAAGAGGLAGGAMGPPNGGAASAGRGSNWNWRRIGRWLNLYSETLEGELEEVQRLEARDRHQQAVTMLREVLETYTDVTRFPVPQCPQAAVLVAATEDAYVSLESVLELHRHWPGSEVRLVPGGHVSSFLLHHDAFRRAIVDALGRLPQQEGQQQQGGEQRGEAGPPGPITAATAGAAGQ